VPDDRPSPERVRAALDELLGWPGLSRSPQLADLLRYVVDKTLSGDAGAIKAYSIAVDVLRRPPSFDPQADPIVRVQARRLRALLEQFYGSGAARADVQIHLPVGRYVPEFRSIASVPPPPDAGVRPPAAGLRPRRPSRFVLNAALGLVFMLVGVGLAVAIVRWSFPASPAPPARAVPERPTISVGAFDNLTGEPALDGEIAQFGTALAGLLQRFDGIEVVRAGDGPTIHGTVQTDDGGIAVRALLSPRDGGGNSWTVTLHGPPGADDHAALDAVGTALAARLGHARGPLHAPGRSWLEAQAGGPAAATPYVCDLLDMTWRERGTLGDADAAIRCFETLHEAAPDAAAAVASLAGLEAWRTQFLAAPGTDLTIALAAAVAEADRAVALAPQSSFVREQQAVVLGRQGATDRAMAAARQALALNPANVDATAVQATLLWADGQWAEADTLSAQALASLAVPPPWYFLTRALSLLRQQRFFDALDAAQALAAGDEEFGPLIALAAAPRVARDDLVARYRPLVLGNPRFQAAGILPRAALRLPIEAVAARLREGLVLAGVPPGAIDGPFNADGSPRR